MEMLCWKLLNDAFMHENIFYFMMKMMIMMMVRKHCFFCFTKNLQAHLKGEGDQHGWMHFLVSYMMYICNCLWFKEDAKVDYF
jgi:hypothetical protein